MVITRTHSYRSLFAGYSQAIRNLFAAYSHPVRTLCEPDADFLHGYTTIYEMQVRLATLKQIHKSGGRLNLDIILVKGLSELILSTYFPSMKIDPNSVFLHVFSLIFPLCPKLQTFFSNFV